MVKYLDPFLDHRKAQEAAHRARTGGEADPMNSLITVEMNITELCNRVCVFCPRVDPALYPNRKLMMDLAVAEKVGSDLAAFSYQGRISFSGFGEPVLNKAFAEHLRIFRRHLPEATIETNTNGDQLNVEKLDELFGAGLSAIYVNLYDGPEQADGFHALFKQAGIEEPRYRLRPHWVGSNEDYGLTLNNRSGVLKNDEIGVAPLSEPLTMRCHYPFYKMLVDWNGDVLFCSNDWGREIIVGNVLERSVSDIWLSDQMKEVRRHLSGGHRNFSPCNKCSVHGTLHGQSSFDLLLAHYRDAGEDGFAASHADGEPQ
ncbi:MAG: radical SAM/SPASM domain-containing protein [Alphaproteobacteria bacterium]